MCGLAGFTAPGPDAEAILARMNATLAHRGPDGGGTFVGDAIAFGHRRLAVIDLFGGVQPRVDTTTGNALVYNGEIYGYRALATDLQADGIALRDKSDTEVLYQLIQRYGVRGAVDKIDGMFAFAYYEHATDTLYLARDRFGEKPLYYGISGNSLVFASEATAIRCHPSFADAGLDPVLSYRYLLLEYLPGRSSGWMGIHKIEPGTILSYRDNRVNIFRYWKPEPAMPGGRMPAIDETQATELLDNFLGNAVRRQIVADVPVGVFLSGGLDSGLIASWAAQIAPHVTAFTVRINGYGFDETPYAQAVAKHLGLRHEIVTVEDKDLQVAFDAIAGKLGEPLGDSSLLASYLVCRAARSTMTVALGGDGADELFAGYPNFYVQRYAPVMAMLPPLASASVRAMTECLPSSGGYMNWRFLLTQLAQGFGASVDRQSFFWMAPFGPQQMSSLWKPDALPRQVLDLAMEPVDSYAQDARGFSGAERLMYLFLRSYLPEDILTKTDRASMFNGLEVRAPFLDRDLAEFALSLPMKFKLRGREGKYILRKVAARHLPREIVARKKHGFAVPIGHFIRTIFKERIHDILLSRDNPLADWFERREIERMLSEHQSGRADHGKKLWALSVLYMVGDRDGRR